MPHLIVEYSANIDVDPNGSLKHNTLHDIIATCQKGAPT